MYLGLILYIICGWSLKEFLCWQHVTLWYILPKMCKKYEKSPSFSLHKINVTFDDEFCIILFYCCHYQEGPTAAVIPVFITGRPVITKWGDYSTSDISIVAEYLLEQL